jgi:hypothetical protein
MEADMANIFVTLAVDVEHGVEIAAEDVAKFAPFIETAAANAPSTVAQFAILAASIEKALADAIAAGTNPTSLIVALPSDAKDFEAVWTAIKGLLLTQGVKV